MARKGHRHKGDLKRFGRHAEDKALRTPSEPTQALPGHKNKFQVMQDRVAKGESPFHPDDAVDSDDDPGFIATDGIGFLDHPRGPRE